MRTSLFSKAEKELMDYLWKADAPLSAWEIAEQWAEKNWTAHYLRTLLKSLEEKGAVECCGAQARGRQYSRRFRCVMTEDEFYAAMAKSTGITVDRFLRAEAAALLRKGDKDEMEELAKELEDILRDFRKRIDEKK